MLPGMKHQRKVRKHHRPGSRAVAYQKVPRQVCQICWTLFDHAICAITTEPQLSTCTPCKEKLGEGFTALVTIGGAHRFVKSPALKPELRGQIRVVGDEELEMLVKKFEKHDPTNHNSGRSPEA